MTETPTGLAVLKLLTAKPFQKSPRAKVTLDKLRTALDRMGSGATPDEVITTILTYKGRGYVQTHPRIIDREEFPSAEFEVWLTPLGLSELNKITSS